MATRKVKVIEAEVVETTVVEQATAPVTDELTDFGPLDELGTFNALVADLGINPDAEFDTGLDVKAMIEKITGTTYTTYTREHTAELEELLALDDDAAAREWFRQQQILSLPEQIALPAGPALEQLVD